MSKFYWFGDSWVYGDELDAPANECFAKLASDAIGAECINLGERATSIDSIVYKFLSIKDQIKPNDSVFFFLTDSNRITIDNKNLLAGAWEDCTPNLHPYNKYWYKYFDSGIQRQNNLDRNLLLLHLACPQAKFCNVFSYNTSVHLGPAAWILPSDQCIAQTQGWKPLLIWPTPTVLHSFVLLLRRLRSRQKFCAALVADQNP